jgi:glycosyltransferase involved in cell wall biosynthesis
MCPARVTPLKGQHVLLEALSKLASDTKPYLVLVGSAQGRDGYVAELTAQAEKLGLRARLVFAGLESHMAAAYAAADLAVVPTIRPEPFGRTIIEAQAASLPVVASDAGGFRETVIAKPASDGGSGWLAKPDSADALAQALDAALQLPAQDLKQMGANGCANVRAHYTQTAMCNRTLHVYQELIG